jgi:hypothetical protein
MLFRVCRDEREGRWVVLVEDRLYGEYLDKEEAILDAVEAAQGGDPRPDDHGHKWVGGPPYPSSLGGEARWARIARHDRAGRGLCR